MGEDQGGACSWQEQQDRPLAYIGPSYMMSSELTSVAPFGTDKLPYCKDELQHEVLSRGSRVGVCQHHPPQMLQGKQLVAGMYLEPCCKVLMQQLGVHHTVLQLHLSWRCRALWLQWMGRCTRI